VPAPLALRVGHTLEDLIAEGTDTQWPPVMRNIGASGNEVFAIKHDDIRGKRS
jgi:hypothetical protein